MLFFQISSCLSSFKFCLQLIIILFSLFTTIFLLIAFSFVITKVIVLIFYSDYFITRTYSFCFKLFSMESFSQKLLRYILILNYCLNFHFDIVLLFHLHTLPTCSILLFNWLISSLLLFNKFIFYYFVVAWQTLLTCTIWHSKLDSFFES